MRHEGKGKDSIFWSRVTFNRRVKFKILGMSGESSSLSCNSLSPHKEHPAECAWSDYCSNFEKTEKEYFFKSNKFTACKVRDGRWKRGSKIFDGVQST